MVWLMDGFHYAEIGQVSPWVLSAFKISIGGYLTSA